jgi:hypothetical protein
MKNLQIYTLFFVIRIKNFYIINTVMVIALKCADYICDIEECKVNQSHSNVLIAFLINVVVATISILLQIDIVIIKWFRWSRENYGPVGSKYR